MSPLRRYILYSTIIGLFSDRFMLNVGPVHLLYFYAILLINLALLAIDGELWMPGRLLGFLGYLLASGVTGLALGSGSVPGFVKDYAGIVPSALYFAAFFRYMRFDVKECFDVYARWAFYIAAFGLVYLPFQPWGGGRLMSICLEPSSFCIVVVPAVVYYADVWQRTRTHGLRLPILLLAIWLSGSSVGFIGLLCGLYLFGRRYRYGKLLAPAAVALLTVLLYNYSDYFRLRLDDTVVGSTSDDVSTVNVSTFGLLANYYVTRNEFASSPLIGGGLGSYITSHERFLESIPGIELVLDEDRLHLGQWDASSLLLRITAELGIVGLLAAGWFLFRYWPRHSAPQERAVAMASLCFIFMKLVRDGTYFSPETFFFFGAYAVLGALDHARAHAVQPPQLAAPELAAPTLDLPLPNAEPA